MSNELRTNLKNVLKGLSSEFNHSAVGGVEYTYVIANFKTCEVITGDIGEEYEAEEFDWIRVFNTDIEDGVLDDIFVYLTRRYNEYHGMYD